MATLSACQTAQATVEPGDELFGLTRGFLAAGARRVAASLWPADDEATSELMTHFYALLPTMTVAAALRKAQRTLRSRRPHPYHWAAFTLAGLR
ncbi:MAG: CHAT domain-containing protein [Armatimonas sp.]